MSATRRHFCGEMRAYLSLAATCMAYSADFLSPECPLKVRVGANSPSLSPTMFSDTSTGMCCLPLCTAIVRPTMSGRIIERRDQVLIGRRSFFSAATATFFCRCRSTNGPFLTERGTGGSSAGSVAAPHDQAGGALVGAGLLALGLPAPRRHRVRVALAGLAFAATVRVVDRVHDDAADRRTDAAPALGTGLAVDDQVVVFVAHLADRGAAVDVHLAHLGGAQADRRVEAFAGHQLHRGAGAAGQLAAAAGLQLDVVDDRADRDVADRQGVARLDRRVGARRDRIARAHALGREDVAALAVGVQHQREVRAAVRVVLEPLDLARHAVLRTHEVDDAVVVAVTATLVPRGDAAHVVAGTGAVLVRGERSDRLALVQVRAVCLHDEAAARRRRFGLDESHGSVFRQVARGHFSTPAKSMVWPSARLTYAFLKSERRPARPPKRLALPATFTTRTASTLTSNISSTAALISGLEASRSTRNTIWLPRSATRALFSETCGASSTVISLSLLLTTASPRACAPRRPWRARGRGSAGCAGRRRRRAAPTRRAGCATPGRASRRRPRPGSARCRA